uniref:Uncharacterized protein n=1 Tax=Aegilops tauschii subsp. strangulata TaxID=200361 RepID=A0A453PID1_AEGTS
YLFSRLPHLKKTVSSSFVRARLHLRPPMAAAAAGATPATARKALASTTSALLSSSPALRRRSLSCSAASAATAPRIAQQPPDLLRWVQREGGFVHPALRVADHLEYGLGVSATAADGIIPPGAVLIDLPGRIPLRLRRPADAADALLMQLADRVPGIGPSDYLPLVRYMFWNNVVA